MAVIFAWSRHRVNIKKNMQKLTFASMDSDEIHVTISIELPSIEDMAGDIVEHDSDVDFEEYGSTRGLNALIRPN